MSEVCSPEEFWEPEEAPEPEEPAEGVVPTPEQWIAHFLRASRGDRLGIAKSVLQCCHDALQCRAKGHEERIVNLTAQLFELQEQNYRLRDDAAYARHQLHMERKS